MKFNKAIDHDIHIRPSDNNGFIVTVGCCTLIYTNFTLLIQELENYLNNTENLQEHYNNSITKKQIPVYFDGVVGSSENCTGSAKY